jgi:hypothetical protein
MKKNNARILCVIEGLNFGGQQLMVYNIFNELKKKESEYNLEFDLIYLFSDNESDDIIEKIKSVFSKVNCIQFPSRSKKYYFRRPLTGLKLFFKFFYLLSIRRYKIVFTNGFNSVFLVSIVKIFLKNFKHYRFVGGDLSRNELFTFSWFYSFLRLHRNVDVFLTWHEQLMFLKTKGIDAQSIDNIDLLIHIDVNLFKPIDPKNFKETLGIGREYCVLGWIGRIDFDLDSSAIFETLELCHFITINYPDFKYKFLVVGDGDKKTLFIDSIRQKNLESNVILLPRQRQEDLVSYYNIIDFEILLDEDPQGGSHLREAMACGRIALSVDGLSGAQARLIQNNHTGILVSPENRVADAARIIVSLTDDQREIIGRRAISFIQEHSYESKAKLILEKILLDL